MVTRLGSVVLGIGMRTRDRCILLVWRWLEVTRPLTLAVAMSMCRRMKCECSCLIVTRLCRPWWKLRTSTLLCDRVTVTRLSETLPRRVTWCTDRLTLLLATWTLAFRVWVSRMWKLTTCLSSRCLMTLCGGIRLLFRVSRVSMVLILWLSLSCRTMLLLIMVMTVLTWLPVSSRVLVWVGMSNVRMTVKGVSVVSGPTGTCSTGVAWFLGTLDHGVDGRTCVGWTLGGLEWFGGVRLLGVFPMLGAWSRLGLNVLTWHWCVCAVFGCL